MENIPEVKITPKLDIGALNDQLQNYQGKIALSIDTAHLQMQLQNELAKAAKIPIQLQLADPSASSYAAPAALSSIQSLLPQFLSASSVG